MGDAVTNIAHRFNEGNPPRAKSTAHQGDFRKIARSPAAGGPRPERVAATLGEAVAIFEAAAEVE